MTDGQTELRWLRRAESIAAFARKNRASDGKFSAAATDVVDLVSLLSRIFYSFTRRISVVTLVEVKNICHCLLIRSLCALRVYFSVFVTILGIEHTKITFS